MNFKGQAKDIDAIDIGRIAATIGAGEDELRAFMDVEAAGSPWDNQRRPKMLFEPHVFYRLLGKGAKRNRAVKEGLAYAKWGMQPYPASSYPRLLKAMAIDEAKALMAASWGLTQILGQYFDELGYASPRAMVLSFMTDAEHHLSATVKLMALWKIDDDLRRLAALKRQTKAADCAAIARTWNGPGYAKHNYHIRLAARHNYWRSRPDTPYAPEPEREPQDAPRPLADLGHAAEAETRPAATPAPAAPGKPVEAPAAQTEPKKLRWSKRMWNGLTTLVSGGGISLAGLGLLDVDWTFYVALGGLVIIAGTITIILMPEVRAALSKTLVGIIGGIALLFGIAWGAQEADAARMVCMKPAALEQALRALGQEPAGAGQATKMFVLALWLGKDGSFSVVMTGADLACIMEQGVEWKAALPGEPA